MLNHKQQQQLRDYLQNTIQANTAEKFIEQFYGEQRDGFEEYFIKMTGIIKPEIIYYLETIQPQLDDTVAPNAVIDNIIEHLNQLTPLG